MPGLLGSRKISRRIRAELQIAAAMARERIVETHVTQLLELVQIARGQISTKRTIEIYTRLHSVDPETARLITSMALANLGKRREATGTIKLDTVETVAETLESPLSLFAQLRRRLRGRVYLELRQQVELHTGRTQAAFLGVHVTNALRFVQILTPDLTVSMAVELYAELVKVRRSVAEIIYFLVLDRLSGAASRWPDREIGQTTPPPAPAEHTLRVINNPR